MELNINPLLGKKGVVRGGFLSKPSPVSNVELIDQIYQSKMIDEWIRIIKD